MSAVAVEGVWKFYGDFPALRDVSLIVEPGACVALIGRNGAGKTTLLRILAGFSRPSKGAVRIGSAEPRDTQTRRCIGFLGHGISLYDELSAWENLTLFGRLYGIADPKRAAAEWLERTGLERVRDGLVREFSRGMRQRLALARAFLHEPSVLLLDEPFTALDDRAISVLQELVRSAAEKRRTVILSTHQLQEALDLATHVALLDAGRMVWRGENSADLVSNPSQVYARYGQN